MVATSYIPNYSYKQLRTFDNRIKSGMIPIIALIYLYKILPYHNGYVGVNISLW